MFTEEQNRFSFKIFIKQTVPGVETHWHFGKEKVQSAAIS